MLFAALLAAAVLCAVIDNVLLHWDHPDHHGRALSAYKINWIVWTLVMVVSSVLAGDVGMAFLMAFLMLLYGLYFPQFKRTYYEGKFDEPY
ncbi:hypothetical protein SAMN05444695_106263 [Rhodococcus triatomae]|uniref:Uncharacterized protein n=2 Tax=Rhodococcus triatomae TaxID=300028 RepID=A0A1G8JQS6_9NOCA|nr:hypothetical protein SAMN05444695_106263 [Rhodococcus triatomae]